MKYTTVLILSKQLTMMNSQLQLGEVDVADIQFNPRSRDDIHQLLMGLHHIYTTDEFKNKIFAILQDLTPKAINFELSAPGMSRWKIFVLGMLRLTINCDYDRLLELANYHSLLRQLLGHSLFNEEIYALQTLKDNVALLTPQILEEINQVIVQAGLRQTRKSKKTNRSMRLFIKTKYFQYSNHIPNGSIKAKLVFL